MAERNPDTDALSYEIRWALSLTTDAHDYDEKVDMIDAVLTVLSERGVLTDAAIGRWLVERLRHTARPVGPNEEMSEPERTEQAYALMELAVAAKRFPALAAGGDAT